VYAAIVVAPENVLVVRCKDEYARMNCSSDSPDRIAWVYDGNTEINAPCSSNTPHIFQAIPMGAQQCDMAAWLENATYNDNIRSISGPYGCADRSSAGVTSTSIVVVLGTFR